jgi:hypothetical protein
MIATPKAPANGALDQPAPPRTPAPSAAFAHCFLPNRHATYVPTRGLSTDRPYCLSSAFTTQALQCMRNPICQIPEEQEE